MSVYLGAFGKVELRRKSDLKGFRATIKPSDIRVDDKIFGVTVPTKLDPDPDQNYELGELITGDEIVIKGFDPSDSTGKTEKNLTFVQGFTKARIVRHVHVNELGGIRLYNTFAKAVNGLKSQAIDLASISSDIDVQITVIGKKAKILAQVTNYELNTERETVDTTSLSDEFRSRISTLMSGSGRMTCLWEYTGDTTKELPNYLVELVLRTKIGSNFRALFYLKAPGQNPGGVAERDSDEIFYDFDAVITSCAVQFATDNVVQITADFITTGKVKLRMNTMVDDAITQENGDFIPLDQDPNVNTGSPSFP
jgi:hypothetical protein